MSHLWWPIVAQIPRSERLLWFDSTHSTMKNQFKTDTQLLHQWTCEMALIAFVALLIVAGAMILTA